MGLLGQPWTLWIAVAALVISVINFVVAYLHITYNHRIASTEKLTELLLLLAEFEPRFSHVRSMDIAMITDLRTATHSLTTYDGMMYYLLDWREEKRHDHQKMEKMIHSVYKSVDTYRGATNLDIFRLEAMKADVRASLFKISILRTVLTER